MAPLAEIAPHLVHPLMHQTISEIWKAGKDHLGVKKRFQKIARTIFAPTQAPSFIDCLEEVLLFKLDLRYEFITIEGNIGAGKTTLATLLSGHYNAKLVLEAFADNPFLPQFYENPKQYAFPLELFFMAERYKQLQEMLVQKICFTS
ncbi:deoxynucleoside kinase [Niabella hibiscisoli]|uniref:deoxynucleoside kinase n=1 Tax=Niabella hibiscisoli TaxID=1825928 RepID=UPI0021D3FF77|nr:deoxynucleoside kinase [Niabella hibiscisoli]